MNTIKTLAAAALVTGLSATATNAVTFNRACEPGDEIVIGAVGDVLLHGALQATAYRSSSGFKTLWPSVTPYMKAADIMYANLESPTAPGVNKKGKNTSDPGPRYDDNVYSEFPKFNTHPSVLKDLKESGVDIVSTANNHSMDRGPLGVDRTIQQLENARLAYFGTRKSKKHPYHTITNSSGWTIGWIACTYSTNGLADPKNQTLKCFDGRVSSLIRSLKKTTDAVIVTPHWGTEYSLQPTGQQRSFARKWLNDGAVAVLGAHPHVPQPFEKITTNDGREGFVAYSLGNFIAAQSALPRKTSLLLYVGLTKRDGKAWVNGVRYLPLYMQHFPHKVVPTGFPGERSKGHPESLSILQSLIGKDRALKPRQRIDTNFEC